MKEILNKNGRKTETKCPITLSIGHDKTIIQKLLQSIGIINDFWVAV